MSIVVASGIESEERVEVRVKAGVVLSGLLHCQFVGEDKRRELMVSNVHTVDLKYSILPRNRTDLLNVWPNVHIGGLVLYCLCYLS